jgi:hypothetical protein
MTITANTELKPISKITKITSGLLYTQIIAAILYIIVVLLNYIAIPEIYEFIEYLDLLKLLLFVTGGSCFLIWMYKAAYNANLLSSEIEISPILAVLYYFIPVLNFWKPYVVMKRIYEVSIEASGLRELESLKLLGIWWALWIFSFVTGQIHYETGFINTEGHTTITNLYITVSDIATILMNFIVIKIISSIYLLQRHAKDMHMPLYPDKGN